MAELSEQDRAAVWADVMRQAALTIRLDHPVSNITKPDLRAAVNALDTWLDSNAASANAALPQPARGSLSTEQKAALLMYVIARRYLTGA